METPKTHLGLHGRERHCPVSPAGPPPDPQLCRRRQGRQKPEGPPRVFLGYNCQGEP